MKKKRTIMILIASGLVMLAFALPISIHYINLRSEPRNIFDEIYLETEKTYRNDNILKNIDGLNIEGYWPDDDPNIAKTPHGNYKKESIPDEFSEVGLIFNFEQIENTASIHFDQVLDSNSTLSVWCMYHFKNKTLKKYAKIIINTKDEDERYIYNKAKVKAYLQKYGITADDLDRYYDEIVNKKVLPDWCSIYDSKFSPSNYGDIIIKTQWKDW